MALGAGGVGAVALTIGVIIALNQGPAPLPAVKPKPPPEAAQAPEAPPEGDLQAIPLAEGQAGAPVVIMTPQGPKVVQAQPLPAQIEDVTVRRVKQSTVYLRVTAANGQIGEGTGFLALEPGLVVTNAHVVGMRTPSAPLPRNVQVVISSGEPGERAFSGTVLGAESSLDLAIVRVEAGGVPLPAPLRLDSALRLSELQKVYIFGFPFGAQLGKNITVSESSISSLRKLPGGGIQQVQVNGGMHPGNSGGPVVNSRGDVVGIAVAIIRGTQINFAVPSDHVQPFIHGFVRDTVVGAAYRAGDSVKLPVKIRCVDPLRRITGLNLEVWAGAQGAIRPASLLQPLPQAGDGPRQAMALAYHDGGAMVDVDLPAVPKGGALWLQPITTGQNGVKMWGAAISVPAADDTPLDRLPATFQLKNEKCPDRTLIVDVSRQIKLIDPQQQIFVVERLEAAFFENVQTEPRGLNIHLHPGYVRVQHEVPGQSNLTSSPGGLFVERLLFTFLMKPDGALKERVRPAQLQSLPILVKMQAEAVFDTFANCFEATNVTAPQKNVEPLTVWTARLPLMVVTKGKNEFADMNLTCTYEGLRQQPEARLAYVRLDGDVRGRSAQADASGKVTGHALIDLDRGYIARAKLAVETEMAVGAVLAQNTTDIQVTRQPGNVMNIAKADPKYKFPDKLEEFKRPSPATIAKGKELLNVKEDLTLADPLDSRKPAGRVKEHKVKLTAGVKYVVEMKTADAKQLDPFLRVESTNGDILAIDDDGGGGQNARIVFTPNHTDDFRIIATVFEPSQLGPFTLSVCEAGKDAEPAKTDKK